MSMEVAEPESKVSWKEEKLCMEAELNSLKLQLETEKWERSLLEMQYRQVVKELLRVYERIEKVACMAGVQEENTSDNHVAEKFDYEITCRRLEAVREKMEANWRYCEAFGKQIRHESEKMESFVKKISSCENQNQSTEPHDGNHSNRNLMDSSSQASDGNNMVPVHNKSITAGDIIKSIFDFPREQTPIQQHQTSQDAKNDTENSASHLHPKKLRLQGYSSTNTKLRETDNEQYRGVVKQVSHLQCRECQGMYFGSMAQLKLHQKLQHKREN